MDVCIRIQNAYAGIYVYILRYTNMYKGSELRRISEKILMLTDPGLMTTPEGMDVPRFGGAKQLTSAVF